VSIVDTATGALVTTVDSGTDGRFSVAMKPGRYSITLINKGGALPRLAAPVTVTVRSGHFADVTLHIDSGMR
jgi:hypothetical protein